MRSMSIIDINGILSFFDLDTRKPDPANPGKTLVGEHLSYERKVRKPSCRRLQGGARTTLSPYTHTRGRAAHFGRQLCVWRC